MLNMQTMKAYFYDEQNVIAGSHYFFKTKFEWKFSATVEYCFYDCISRPVFQSRAEHKIYFPISDHTVIYLLYLKKKLIIYFDFSATPLKFKQLSNTY